MHAASDVQLSALMPLHLHLKRLRALPGFLAGMGRTWLLLGSAAVLPLLLFGGWVGYWSAARLQAETAQVARMTTDRAAERIAADLAAEASVLRAMAASPTLDVMDLPAFRIDAERVQAQHALWQTVELATPTGTPMMNLVRPAGADLPLTADLASLRSAVEKRRVVVGGVGGPVGPEPGRRLVTLWAPVIRDGDVRAVLSIALSSDSIGTMLRAAGAPGSWIGVVIDGSGRIIARTRAGAQEQNQLASETLRAAIARTPDGQLTGRTQTFYRTLEDSDGWVIAFGIPRRLYEAPVRRALVLLMVEGGAGLLLAAGLTALAAKDLTERRTHESERAAWSLRASEEARALAVEAAELGVWRWRADIDAFDGSARCLALLSATRAADGNPTRWADAFAAADADHRAALAAVFGRSLGGDVTLEEEIRVSTAEANWRWIRITGRRFGSPELPAALQGVVADITQSKRLEAERLDLLRSMATAQEQERRRIARELHDQVGQTVTGLSLGLKTLQDGLAENPAMTARLDWLRKLAAGIGQDIHRAASDLRPTALDDFGLVPALSALARRWGEQHGITVDLQTLSPVVRLNPEIETVIYRVVQESLTNVIKHADAMTVSVLLEVRGPWLQLIVEDDGRGFDPATSTTGDRVPQGLSGMRERLRLVGGSLELESAPGAGTTLFVRVPTTLDQVS